jgi:hypothetical protein
MVQFEFFVPGIGVSSKSIRRGGEKSSSICPCRTLHIKAARKKPATVILANKSKMITPIAIFL